MTQIEVEVTQADIDNGKRRNCAECPIALAVVRATDCRWASVALFEGRAQTPDRTTFHFDLPPRVTSFIKAFDGGYAVAPFTFTLSLKTETGKVLE